MMRKLFRWLGVFMAALVGVLAFPACGGDERKEVDETMTQLYVSVVPSGYGDSWLYAAAERFEQMYAQTSFEEGKLGVQVFVSADAPSGSTAASFLAGLSTEVIFTEDVDYYDLVNRNLLYDMTAAVEKPLEEYDEEQSIADKMTTDYREFFKTGSGEGKYYALPFNVNYTGIIYDVDLFEDEGLYFKADTSDPNRPAKKPYQFTSIASERSNGPDGKTGVIDGVDYSADDGLPATYDQFFALCEEMVTNHGGIVPITWPGMYQFHMYRYLYCLWAANEGYEQMQLNYTFKGSATDLVEGFRQDGTPIISETPTPITDANGYLLNKQAGKYYALNFLERLVSNKNYYDETLCFGGAQQHTDAQNEFLLGRFDEKRKRTAMLIDGAHWENEATDIFNRMKSRYGAQASKENRKFGFLPNPKPTDADVGKESVVMDAANTALFINGNIQQNKVKVAETFVRFMHTRESLSEFNRITGICRPYDYEMTEAELGQMSHFGQSVYATTKASRILAPHSDNRTFLNNYSVFNPLHTGVWTSKVGNTTTYNTPSTAMHDNGVTAQGYFEGLSYYYNQSFWNNIVAK